MYASSLLGNFNGSSEKDKPLPVHLIYLSFQATKNFSLHVSVSVSLSSLHMMQGDVSSPIVTYRN